MNRNRLIAPLALTALALAVLHASCDRHPVAALPAPVSPQVSGDTIVFPAGSPQRLELRAEPVTVEAAAPLVLTGRLVWNEDRTARVLPPVAGRVASLHARLGATVPRGGLLAMLASPDFGQAQADGARAEADLRQAARSRDRLARLVERGAAPRKELESAEADVERARAEAARTAARLSRWGGRSGEAPDGLYRITSPLAGVVVERTLNPGQEVRPDATTTLFTVSDPSRLWLSLDVTERDLPLVTAGRAVSVKALAYPGRTFPGTLDVVGDALDPATRTVKARATVENGERLLKAEMYVVAELASPDPPAVVVPSRAVLSDGARHVVFVEEGDGRYRRVVVEVGPERGGRVTVRSGLSRGARVVTDGSLLLASFLTEKPAGEPARAESGA